MSAAEEERTATPSWLGDCRGQARLQISAAASAGSSDKYLEATIQCRSYKKRAGMAWTTVLAVPSQRHLKSYRGTDSTLA